MCGMPDPECRMPNAPAYSYGPEEHVCRAAEKRLHDEVREADCRARSVGCEQLWFVRVNCKILFDMPWIAQAEQRAGQAGERERGLCAVGATLTVSVGLSVCVRSGHKKCVLPPRG